MFIIAVQMTAVSLVMEKSSRLLESCRMMGMKELPYWLSFVIVDAGLQGFLLSFLMSSLGGILSLFWNVGQGKHGHGDGTFGELLGLLYFSTFALTAMAFAISSCFDNPQAAGMTAFALVFGSVVLFFIMILGVPELFDSAQKQVLWCLFPPVALQIGVSPRA